MTERDEHELMTFAAQWAPFGGPPAEEVLVSFGMTMPRFEFRLCEALSRRQNRSHPAFRALNGRSRTPRALDSTRGRAVPGRAPYEARTPQSA
ncbi:hypothetical protein SAMN04490239_9435 [Rhodococcus koreensis]|uniref:DUF3263 domain-containing protein n=1 Tax=Rhodococcus koreensis TaxID=99653 RepID=A0A1H5EZZ5_9NOCA|nr:hypothetical protein SAMN04490239_9435 [Rhodococcus koreensis]